MAVAPKRRSAEAKALQGKQFKQRVVPDKKKAGRSKAAEIDEAWRQHNDWIRRGERD